MSYSLEFLVDAKKEWDRLDPPIRLQFAKKLKERKDHPHIAKDKLHGMKDCYKIKLRSAGFRLVYKVFDQKILIQVIVVGKRDKNEIYHLAYTRSKILA